MAGRTIAYDRARGISDRVTSRVSYSTHPPRSGPHAPLAAQDGDYAGVSTPLTELLMHPLEHGRVRIQYRPGLARAAVRALEALFEDSPYHVLLHANATSMRADVAVTTWGAACCSGRYSAPCPGTRSARSARGVPRRRTGAPA